MESKGKNLEAVQVMNRKLLLKLLQQNIMCSRANLSEQSGLKQATITNIINDFISWGLVEETGIIEGNKGRRAIGIRLKEDSFYVIGIRLSRKYFEIGIFSLTGKLIGEKCKRNVIDTSPNVVMDTMQAIIEKLAADHSDKIIVAIGVAVPGPYYFHEGVMETVTNFRGWKKVSIKSELQKRFQLPVMIDHDANAGVLAECSFKVNPEKYRTVVYVALGQGIGAGIFHNGEVFRGATGIAGEIGHASVNVNGPQCECGNRGCLTLYVSTITFTENVNEALKKSGRATVDSFDDLIERIQKKDADVYPEFRSMMRYLSAGIMNLVYSYNPSMIIIGDEMSRVGVQIIEEIKDNLAQIVERKVVDQAELCLTSFQMDPAFIGAAELAIDYVFGHTELLRE
ncbi:MAG: ROK family protein [Lachnospiraceae bacterium]|nr:ROK family protein [Lachnospiraceae bacterium]